MYISELAAQNLKGSTFTHKLAPLTLFTGPNFSGKTTRIDAIRLLIRGTLPDLGARVGANTVGLLASGSSFSVRANVEDPDNKTAWAMSRSYTFKGASLLPDYCNPEAAELMDSPLMDSSEYFAMTDSERTNFVFGLAGGDSASNPNAIVADLRKISLGDDDNEHTEAARETLIEVCRKALTLQGINAGLDELTRDKGTLKSMFTLVNARATNSLGAVKMLTELKLREGECSAESISSLEKTLEAVKARGKEAQEVKGALSQRSKTANQTADRRKFLELATANARDYTRDIEDLKKQIAGRIVPTTEELQVLVKQEQVNGKDFAEVDRKAAIGKSKVESLSNKIVELIHEKAEIEALPACPHCGGKTKGWQKRLITALDEKIAEVTTERDAADSALIVTISERQRLMKECEACAEKVYEARTVIEWDKEDRAKLSVMERDMETLQASKAELATLQVTAPPSPAELEAAEAELQSAIAEYRNIEAQIKAATKLQQDILRAEEAAEEHKKAIAEVKANRAFQKALAETKARLVEDLFGGLIATANRVFGHIIPSPLAFRDGVIGRISESGNFVTHKTMSDSEKMLTYLAVAVALSADRRFRILLIGDLGAVDQPNKVRVLFALERAIQEGIIHQAIVADPLVTNGEALEDLPPSCLHIDLGQPASR